MRNPAVAYQDQAVQTADGPRLLIMICDRLAADMSRAEAAIEARDYAVTDENLQHAQRLIRMLRSALDPDGFKGGHELMSVYVFLERHLIKANLEKSAAVVRECAELFRPIHEAWVGAVNVSERSDVSHVG
jgi:flagellar secretion chaperone FliS